MPPYCPTPINLCAIRVTRLFEDGAIDFGSDTLYIADSPITLTAAPVVSTAERFEQKNGCGAICAVYDEDCDKVTGYTLALANCRIEPELYEMMVGGVIEVDGSADTVGVQDPDPLAPCDFGVILEAFQLAWEGDERMPYSGAPAYIRHRFPKTRWISGSKDMAAGINPTNFTGKATPNISANLGPSVDWPAQIGGPYAWDIVTSLPTAACGYQDNAS